MPSRPMLVDISKPWGSGREWDGGDTTRRIGIAIGPQYGTVSASFIKQAAREALKAEDIDLLAVLGFAFDPQVTGVTEEDGVTVDASEEGFANLSGIRNWAGSRC